MPRSGLTRERVIAAAAELVEEKGAAAFSMRALADTLGIKTASLYSHVESMETLMTEVCVYALNMLRELELAALEGRNGEAAIRALADAYLRFTREHRELYFLIMSTSAKCSRETETITRCMLEPFMRVLDGTELTWEAKLHWQRALRAILHGFASQEAAGLFAHLPIEADESFGVAIQCYIDGLGLAIARAGRK